MDHESSCKSGAGISVLHYVKSSVQLFLYSFPTESYHHKAYASELLKILCIIYDLQLSLKIVLRSVEVEDPFLWHINSREVKELMVVTRERVGKWTHGHKPANFKKLFERNEDIFKRWTQGSNILLTSFSHYQYVSCLSMKVLISYQQKPNIPYKKSSLVQWWPVWKKGDEMWKKK